MCLVLDTQMLSIFMDMAAVRNETDSFGAESIDASCIGQLQSGDIQTILK
jgi:hypothetical protein